MRLRLSFAEVAVIVMIGLLLLQFALTEYRASAVLFLTHAVVRGPMS